LYPIIISFIEILSLLTLFVTIAFFARRYFLKVERFQKPELDGFPRIDAALILIFEMILIFAIFSMNCADTVLQAKYPESYHHTGFFAISGWLGPALFSHWDGHLLVFLERFGWWLHLGMVFTFLNYLPFSKHLHIILAFPNTFFARLNPKGQMDNMPAIMNEVRSMMGLEVENAAEEGAEMPMFGAKDVTSLSWKNVMDAYTCTECGRCTAACPANITGKKLSPRKIMMDVRDRAEEVGKKLDSCDVRLINTAVYTEGMQLTKDNFEDGRSLFNYISGEELHACTTCNACVEACPVLINPLDIILQLRRYEILTLSAGPSDWMPMFTSLENGNAVWQLSDDRDKWVADAM
jgi:heterodisulfide reductase subunit C